MAVELTTPRLLLRMFRASDFEPYVRMCSDPEVMRWIGAGRVRTREECEQFFEIVPRGWAAGGFGLFAVEHVERGTFIGFCGLAVPEFLPAVMPTVEIGWRFERESWGKGLATEAARAVLRFALETRGLPEVIAIIQQGNLASERVAQKIGMRLDRELIDPKCERPVNIHVMSSDAWAFGPRPNDVPAVAE